MAQGLLGFFGLMRQNSFGTPVTSFYYVPIISESVTKAIAQLDEGNLRVRLGESPVYEGLNTISGDITFNPHPLEIGHFLYGLCGREVATTAVGSGVVDHSFAPTHTGLFDAYAALPPYSLEVHRDSDQSFRYNDAQINRLEFRVNQGALVEATAGFIARQSSLVAETTPTFRAPNSVWAFQQASVSLASAANADIESLVFTVERAIEGRATLDGQRYISRYAKSGPDTVRVSGVLDFRVSSEFVEFNTQTQRALVLNVAMDPTSGPSLRIHVPLFRYEAFPINLGGPGRLTASFTGRGAFDTTSNTGIMFFLTNSHGTAYSAM